MKIQKSKVDALYEHLSAGGESDPRTVAFILEIEHDDTEAMQAYFRAVNRRKEQEQVAPAVTPSRVSILHEDNTLEELEIFKTKGDSLIVRKKVKCDPVTIMFGGEPTEVDCEKLRKLPLTEVIQPYGVTPATLLIVAELAREV